MTINNARTTPLPAPVTMVASRGNGNVELVEGGVGMTKNVTLMVCVTVTVGARLTIGLLSPETHQQTVGITLVVDMTLVVEVILTLAIGMALVDGMTLVVGMTLVIDMTLVVEVILTLAIGMTLVVDVILVSSIVPLSVELSLQWSMPVK